MSQKDEALDFLKNRPIYLTLAIISAKTGIPVGWLKAFGQNRINDPGISKIEALLNMKKTMGNKGETATRQDTRRA